ncbi:RpiR family transcriptional regulator [Streptomyces sp. CB00455]|uniref:MurR/RpiR family transcriptional regulator n=1 Tax=Streptomyces sp. CB00455 TaxID=1703927 RepID=UPI00093BEAFE|nr:MurR/RpiR family transcriptional regulator [Streptomyces sp. CB00455]OKK21792.1 RpiR family transcriptional regulator [Streptomyces sp. CB00455]
MAAGSLADDIRHKLGELSPAERKVARVLLANYPAAGFETVAAIAERAAVSAPTVLRFAARLGYRGFPDFQAALRQELDERNASPLSLYESTDYGRRTPDSEATGRDDSLLTRANTAFAAALTHTLNEVPPHDLGQAIHILSDRRRRITLAGGRFTHLLAQYLAKHLMQLRDDVRILPESAVERTAHLAHLGRRDAVILFDYRRYEEDKTAIAHMTRESGGKVIVFTDAWLSPATAHADVVLSSQVSAFSPYDSLVPTLAVIETVIAGVLQHLGEDAHQHLQRSEDIARRIGTV